MIYGEKVTFGIIRSKLLGANGYLIDRCYSAMLKGYRVLSRYSIWAWRSYVIWLSGKALFDVGGLILGALW